MAIGMANYPNVDTTDPTDYPNGIIKDNPGDGSGTKVNKATNGDIQMFFDKLLRQQGIVASNTPDNETNGYQLISALNGVWKTAGISLGSGVSSIGNPYYPISYKVCNNTVYLAGAVLLTSFASGLQTALTLPFPISKEVKLTLPFADSGTIAITAFEMLGSGALFINSGGTSSAQIYLDGICIRIS